MRSRPRGYQALTRDGGSREMERSFLLHASLDTLAVSRRAVDETLWYLGYQRVEIARIAVDELVGNAINHGHLDPTDDIVLEISADSDRARIEVKQPTTIADARVREPGEAGVGLSLRIVSSLADRWLRGRTSRCRLVRGRARLSVRGFAIGFSRCRRRETKAWFPYLWRCQVFGCARDTRRGWKLPSSLRPQKGGV